VFTFINKNATVTAALTSK